MALATPQYTKLLGQRHALCLERRFETQVHVSKSPALTRGDHILPSNCDLEAAEQRSNLSSMIPFLTSNAGTATGAVSLNRLTITCAAKAGRLSVFG